MIGIGIGRKRKNWSKYWADRLDFWFYERSGNEFIDKYGNQSAKILTSACHIDATHYIKGVIADFGSGITAVTGGYIEARVYYNGGTGVVVIFASADTATNTNLFYLGLSTGKPVLRINIASSTAKGFSADNAVSVGWHTLKFISSGGHWQLIIDGGAILTVGNGLTQLTADTGEWIGNVASRDNVTIGYIDKATDFNSAHSCYIDYIDFNGTNKWIFSGRNGYVFDVLGGVHLTWVTASQFYLDKDAGRDFIDYGFTVWTKLAASDMLVPYSALNTPVDASIFLEASGYSKLADYAGVSDGLANSYLYRDDNHLNSPPVAIGFNELGSDDSIYEIFDRSNTTRQEDISRTLRGYDSTSLATKSRYSAGLCLSYVYLQTLFKAGYKNRIIPIQDDVNNPTKITGFMIAKTNLT